MACGIQADPDDTDRRQAVPQRGLQSGQTQGCRTAPEQGDHGQTSQSGQTSLQNVFHIRLFLAPQSPPRPCHSTPRGRQTLRRIIPALRGPSQSTLCSGRFELACDRPRLVKSSLTNMVNNRLTTLGAIS